MQTSTTVYGGDKPLPKDGTVIIVGGGLAGLVAATNAAAIASRVILFDKEPKLGGNSAKATSGMNAAGTEPQVKGGVDDHSSVLMMDTLQSGHGLSNKCLAETLAFGSLSAWRYLKDECGAALEDVSMCGGHSKPRTHRFAPGPDGRMRPVGFGLIQTMQAKLEATAKETGCEVELRTGCRVVGLIVAPSVDLVHPGAVVGVQVVGKCSDGNEGEAVDVLADAVVLTTGGYGNDHGPDSLLKKHAPRCAELASTNGLQATGDGVRLGMSVGAETVDLDQVQIHPTGLVDPSNEGARNKFLGPEALRGKGGILLNDKGKRFYNELGRRDDVTKAIFKNCAKVGPNHVAYLVMSPEAVESYGSGTIGFYASKGFFTKCDGAAAVAELIGVDAAVVEETLKTYREACDSETADEFGRPDRPCPPSPTDSGLMVARITPVVHYTMGGVVINGSAEVMYRTTHGNLRPIPGLFAAGEATGGVHGGNRLAGNSLLECVVFGRIAGQRAGHAAKLPRHKRPLSTDQFTPLRLSEKELVGGNIYKFKFDLPSPFQNAGLAVGQYVNVRALVSGDEVIRPYSPLTRPGDSGRIELMVKADPNLPGKMSQYMSTLEIGDTLEFRGPMGGIDLYQARVSKVGLIAGGVGIAPMISIIRTVFRERTPHDIKLMYGAVTEADMPFRDILTQKASSTNNFDLFLSLDKPPEGWKHNRGFITAAEIKEFMFPPQDGLIIIICGPPPMCHAMKASLREAGYADRMVFSYM